MKALLSTLIFFSVAMHARAQTKYLGQPLPGSTPVVFAPGLISTPNVTEFGSVFSKDGTEFFYAAEPGGIAQIRYKKLINGRWTDAKTIISHEVYSYNDPFLSPDEKRLYFISNQPISGSGEKKDYDIWYCVREGNGWSAPVNAGSKINSEANEYYMSFTKTGTMYFSSNRKSTGDKEQNYDIYSSRYVDGAFQNAEKLPDAINSPHYEADVFVDANESYLIFCANRPGGYGGGDLYISFKNADGAWQPAKNLGKEINADHYDFCPFVTSDGNYFFYTKGADIYWVDAKILQTFR